MKWKLIQIHIFHFFSPYIFWKIAWWFHILAHKQKWGFLPSRLNAQAPCGSLYDVHDFPKMHTFRQGRRRDIQSGSFYRIFLSKKSEIEFIEFFFFCMCFNITKMKKQNCFFLPFLLWNDERGNSFFQKNIFCMQQKVNEAKNINKAIWNESQH